MWAEYIIFAWKTCGVRFEIEETIEGSGKVFGDDGNVLPARVFTMNVLGDARLLNLSQKTFRKNGRYTDSDGTGRPDTDSDGTGRLDVDSVSSIAGMITSTSTAIANDVANLRLRNTAEEDSRNLYRPRFKQILHWVELDELANDREWDEFVCRIRYNGACLNAREWISLMKGL